MGEPQQVIATCRPADGGWSCRVSVGSPDDALGYEVSISNAELERFAPGADATALVSESFRFLLEREPRESILRRFELSDIERYFPDYASEIGRRLR